MKHQNNFIIPAQTLELVHLPPDSPLSLSIGENTLVAMPERMTALQVINAINVLNDTVTELLCAVKDACGSCEEYLEDGKCPYGDYCDPEECPYGDTLEPAVTVSDAARKQMGIPLDAKLELFPDEGEGLVAAADYKHDITDVPESVWMLLAAIGVCPEELNDALQDEEEIWHG